MAFLNSPAHVMFIVPNLQHMHLSAHGSVGFHSCNTQLGNIVLKLKCSTLVLTREL